MREQISSAVLLKTHRLRREDEVDLIRRIKKKIKDLLPLWTCQLLPVGCGDSAVLLAEFEFTFYLFKYAVAFPVLETPVKVLAPKSATLEYFPISSPCQ